MRIEIPNTLSAKLKGAVSRGVKAVELDASGRLIFTLSDNSTADLGCIPMLTAQSVFYQSGASGTEAPTGEWSDSIPTVAQGAYLWTRTVLSLNDGTELTAYSVSRMGLDGSGSVITVNAINPDESGNVTLSATDVGAAEAEHGHELSGVTGLSEALSGKAAASHGHELSDVTGLSNALSEKAAASHSHTPASIGAIAATEKGGANGVATLDANAKVEAGQASARIVSAAANLTLGLTHAGAFIYMDSTSDLTVTVPVSASVAFPIGTEIEICRWNTGTVTIAPETGVTICSIDSAMAVSGQYGCVCLKKIGADTWLLSGALG